MLTKEDFEEARETDDHKRIDEYAVQLQQMLSDIQLMIGPIFEVKEVRQPKRLEGVYEYRTTYHDYDIFLQIVKSLDYKVHTDVDMAFGPNNYIVKVKYNTDMELEELEQIADKLKNKR